MKKQFQLFKHWCNTCNHKRKDQNGITFVDEESCYPCLYNKFRELSSSQPKNWKEK